jgi:glycosyltransferase involved in cell wall biosynthesis
MGGDGWGGVERWMMDLALGLRGRGHRVASAGRPGALWTARSREAGLPVLETPMRGDLGIGEARALARWMRGQGVEVIVTKLHKGIRISGLAARFAGRPPVVALMGLVEVERGLRYRLTYGLFLDWIVTLSEGMRRDILAVRAGVPGERVVAIPYGVDPAARAVPAGAAAAARASLGAGPGDLLVVAVGRLHAQKRFDRMIEAFAMVRARVPEARLAVVGTGSLRGELEGRARSLGLAERITWAGFRADTAALFAAADLFALSSDDEGLPMVVIEAMAAGLPVVATEVGSIRDLVADGETGIVVPREAAPLAEAVADLLLDAPRRKRLGEAGRARVRERFSLARCVEATEAFLARAAGR